MLKVGGAIVVAALIVLLVFLGLTASGAPSAPSAVMAGTPNPQLAQTLQVTFQSQVYSTLPPTSVYIVYSATQGTASGGNTSLASNVKIIPSAVSNNGPLYVVAGAVTLTTTSICAGAACVGIAYNITVTAQAFVSTYLTLFSSAKTVSQFSNTVTYTKTVPLTAPSPNPYYLSAYVPFTFAIALGFIGAGILGVRHVAVIATGVALVVVTAGEILVWLVLTH